MSLIATALVDGKKGFAQTIQSGHHRLTADERRVDHAVQPAARVRRQLVPLLQRDRVNRERRLRVPHNQIGVPARSDRAFAIGKARKAA